MSKYGLHGQLKATTGNGDQLAQILLEAANLLEKVKGCQLYVVSRDPNDYDVVWITEAWDSEADHDNSLQLQEVKDLILQAVPILDGKPAKGQQLEILGGTGLRK